MIKAVIFDCFGVLVTDGWLPFKQRHFGHDQEKMERATELNHMVDAGLIPYDKFVEEIASMAHVSAQKVDSTLKSVVPNESLIEFIAQELKPHFKIGMLSNVAGDWLQQMFTAEQLALFDEVMLSYDTKVIKPDPRAYQIAAERLDVAPSECLFIDDQERNVTAAQEQGMQGLWYRSAHDNMQEFHKILELKQ